MSKSKIEWTESTWNPTTGCTKISQGCKYCYAAILHERLRAMGLEKYQHDFTEIVCHESELDRPKRWRNPRLIFVNSMSDLFHEDVPLGFIKKVFKTMNETPQHTYQILTKRSERLKELSDELNWTPNIWMGVSIESMDVIHRLDDLKSCGANVKFISAEPLLGPLPSMSLDGVGWVIVGGESGRTPRPMKEEWVQDILEQCEESGVPFFFKQWGGKNKKKAGRLMNGRTYDEMPRLFDNIENNAA